MQGRKSKSYLLNTFSRSLSKFFKMKEPFHRYCVKNTLCLVQLDLKSLSQLILFKFSWSYLRLEGIRIRFFNFNIKTQKWYLQQNAIFLGWKSCSILSQRNSYISFLKNVSEIFFVLFSFLPLNLHCSTNAIHLLFYKIKVFDYIQSLKDYLI